VFLTIDDAPTKTKAPTISVLWRDLGAR